VDLIAGLDNVKRKFLTLPGLELLSLGSSAHRQLLYLLCYLRSHMPLGRSGKLGGTEIKWSTSAAADVNLLGAPPPKSKNEQLPSTGGEGDTDAFRRLGEKCILSELSICYCRITRMQGKIIT
jgi:hypothetical protein